MATVIFSNQGDTDTAVLQYIWAGMSKINVVEINKSTINPMQKVNDAIARETDTLIMCGHGTSAGLLNPSYKDGSFLINSSNKKLIKANRIIGIWCHAKDFAERQGVRGFWSSMFISNKNEAKYNGITTVSDKSITEQEILFCIRLNELIKSYTPMKAWIKILKEQADYDNPVTEFNYEGLRYYKTAPECKSYGYDYYDYYGSNWYNRYRETAGYGDGYTFTGTGKSTTKTETKAENKTAVALTPTVTSAKVGNVPVVIETKPTKAVRPLSASEEVIVQQELAEELATYGIKDTFDDWEKEKNDAIESASGTYDGFYGNEDEDFPEVWGATDPDDYKPLDFSHGNRT